MLYRLMVVLRTLTRNMAMEAMRVKMSWAEIPGRNAPISCPCMGSLSSCNVMLDWSASGCPSSKLAWFMRFSTSSNRTASGWLAYR